MLAQLHQGEIPTPRPAADHGARRVGDAVLHQPPEPGVQVFELGTADVAGQRVAPFGAVPGRTAVVDHRHGESRVDVRLCLRAPPILVQPGGSAVGTDQHRERPVALRRGVEPMDRLPVRVVEPERDVRTSRRRALPPGEETPHRPGRPGCAGPRRRSPSGARPSRPGARVPQRPVRPDARSGRARPSRDRSGTGDAGPRRGWPAVARTRRATSRTPRPDPAGRSARRSTSPSPAPRSSVASSPDRSWITASRPSPATGDHAAVLKLLPSSRRSATTADVRGSITRSAGCNMSPPSQCCRHRSVPSVESPPRL